MGSGKIGSILKIGDFVRWSGEVIEKGEGFVEGIIWFIIRR